MSLNEYLQDRIDRRDRENAPDQFTIDHALNQQATWVEIIKKREIADLEDMEALKDVGLLSSDYSMHVHAAALAETFGDCIDKRALDEAFGVIKAADAAQ
jgi:hypothetical protein